ncbi:putative pollen-specific leucine-rich repeat extensin-like protein 3 [Iris pallida]|uniref:Pollen-specific leucine-rich repeat extensin-like protein 3 n=1 Tax=Iris pallida TaxID=29817 RepID=A0AAX6FRY0_IRIPA|nr:putative pollen-specific leucine-rich repeat extensin-like protein 3 [Iris pallida]
MSVVPLNVVRVRGDHHKPHRRIPRPPKALHRRIGMSHTRPRRWNRGRSRRTRTTRRRALLRPPSKPPSRAPPHGPSGVRATQPPPCPPLLLRLSPRPGSRAVARAAFVRHLAPPPSESTRNAWPPSPSLARLAARFCRARQIRQAALASSLRGPFRRRRFPRSGAHRSVSAFPNLSPPATADRRPPLNREQDLLNHCTTPCNTTRQDTLHLLCDSRFLAGALAKAIPSFVMIAFGLVNCFARPITFFVYFFPI